ncbi:putative heterokaryon incompatibility protein or allele protein [Seiridium cardinale]
MTDYDNIYEDFIERPDGPYFRLLTLLPKEPDTERPATPQPSHVFAWDPVVVQKAELKPKDTDLEIELSVHRFEECPEYEALSYSWGNPKGQKYIVKCNGHEFHALTSLRNALRALRLPDKPRTLWIDAICINQNSDTRAVTERSQQLQMMQDVYRHAKKTVVWLGLEKEQNYAPAFENVDDPELSMVDVGNFKPAMETAISLHLDTLITDPASLWKDRVEVETTWGRRVPIIQQAALRLNNEWDRRTENDPRDMTYEKIVEKGIVSNLPKFLQKPATSLVSKPKIKKKFVDGLTNAYQWRKSLRNLLCREWWSRVWIIQEACLAQELVICCGDASLDLDLLFLGLVLYAAFPEDVMFSGHIMTSWTLPEVMEYRNLYQYEKGATLPTFLHLLTEFRSSDATNPKDHVYSLLGLLAPNELDSIMGAGFKPDYSQDYTVSRCFIDTASSIVASSRDLNLLALPQPGRHEIAKSKAGKLPSWVPDWSAKTILILTPKHGFEVASDKSTASLFSACGSCIESTARIQDNQILSVSGYVADTIIKVAANTLSGMSDTMLDFLQGGQIAEELNSEENPGEVKPMDMIMDMLATWGKVSSTIFEWEEFVAAGANPYPTGEDLERVSCTVRCFGYAPDGLEAAVGDFQEYKKAMNSGRRIYNLAMSPSRPSLPSFLKRKPSEERTEPSKARQALMSLAMPDARSRAKMVKFNKLQQYSVGRKLAWTERGYLALVSQDTEAGDRIVLCKGSRLPVVARATDRPDQWKVLNGCYVHGIMKGEAWDADKCAGMQLI